MDENTETTLAVGTAETALTGAETTQTAQTQGNGQASATAQAHDTENPEMARLQKELEKVRKEAAGYRVKAKELEDAQKTEEERRAARLTELEEETKLLKAEAKSKSAQAAITVAAAKIGIKPELAVRLIAPSELEFDDNNNPTNAEKLLAALVKTAPELVGGGGNSANPARSGQEVTAAEKEEFLEALAGNRPFNPFGNPERSKEKGGGMKFPTGWNGSDW